MNSRNIKKHLIAKVNDWLQTIEDENVKKEITENLIISGGSLVSLLTGEDVHDYDCYFRTQESCIAVAQYYVDKWNKDHEDKKVKLVYGNEAVELFHLSDTTNTVRCFVQSSGVVSKDNHFCEEASEDEQDDVKEKKSSKNKDKYRPIYISSNAITLSDKIQIVTRFYGEIEELHKNFDYVHCTCAYDFLNDSLYLPEKALESIINKELIYVGSRYPLCSILRSKKYILKGYHINAGQYVKMVLQLNNLDLSDIYVLQEQLTGVDSYYFSELIDRVKEDMSEKKYRKY